ncbi:primosomal protein N' (replication factor Y) - superfamily II helicase [Phaeovulum sp.]|uniref:primosomal protein N' (replication factor Y) - superfamily II helicase n=1 Tax=Phaeovulum sp. TaxID=2934796 RepID=UPI0039E5A5A3
MSAKPAQHHYPCESCGADLRFAPGETQLVCDHCGHIQEIPHATGRGTTQLVELDLAAALRAELPELEVEEQRTLSCPNCGSLIALAGAIHASECPFCATPVVADTGTKRLIKPQGVVPFVLKETEARAALGRWLGRLWFAPSGLTKYARRGRKMTGVYAPYWTFDAQTRSQYQGQRGDYYYETETVMVRVNGRTERRQQQVRKVRWHRVAGRVARAFDDVLIYAARSLPTPYADALRPWDLAKLRDYRPDYLAGFEAEGYTVELREGHYLARAEMAHVIASDVRRDIGGDEQRVDRVDTVHSDETFKHILLPIWTAAYKYRGRSFRFVVNGQTGAVQGERPWSAWKIAFAVTVVVIVIAVGAYFGQQQ